MGILSSTVSLTRYRVNGSFSDAPIEHVEEGIRKFKIQDIDNEPSELSVGWTSLFDPFNPDFEGSSFLVASFFVFSLRIDKKSVPVKVINKYVDIEEKKRLAESGREFLSKNEKKQLKDDVKNILLMKVPSVPNIFDIIWDYDTNRLWFFSTQKAANEELESLFLKSFNISLIKLFPYTLADFELGLSDAEKDLLLKLKPESFME
ncbi:MAG: recombination-associated protein RdgC [Proteobacteria bacterium]|nr:recombination-associated protein RdgC [Pseudomonadota bacterium]